MDALLVNTWIPQNNTPSKQKKKKEKKKERNLWV